ncbi:heparinase II/III family protein [Rhodobacteraceae bacterium DSL-40]|uniref:heparinase II/III family protein n=1 Tax=Amaricoccus sp. B4 TaxID=3368557 RepID=UPI000DACD215
MPLFLKALRARLTRPARRWANRLAARRARLGTRPQVAETLPEPVLFGDADHGLALVGGRWLALGHEVSLDGQTIWAARLPDPRLDPLRHGFDWLDHLGALGNRAARGTAQAWLADWIRRYGRGSGPGWTPEIAGARARQWTAHAALLAQGLERAEADRFWRALAAQQHYLAQTWRHAAPGLGRLRALSGLVWSGLVLPHPGHRVAMAELGKLAEALIDDKGEIASRRPEDLAEAIILLIWTARVLENAGQHAPPAHLAAIVRSVPVLRALRMGDGSFARFQGGGAGDADRLDQALAELRIGVQSKPPLSMGYCRLQGGRTVVVLDAAAPPGGAEAAHAHAGTLAFEMSASRQPLIANQGPGEAFGRRWGLAARQTAAHSTVEIAGRPSAGFRTRGLVASAFGPRLVGGPARVSIRQAQDASGQWLLATHDGYASRFGVIHERRVFVGARGREVRGEDILTIPDAAALARFGKATRGRPLPFAVRFHLPPSVAAEDDPVQEVIRLTLPSGEVWAFRAAGGIPELAASVWFDPAAAAPAESLQIVLRSELEDGPGQVIWSLSHDADAPPPEEDETP